MYEMSLFGIGMLLLLATWRFMIKPSLLDNTRDRLFDLRDDVLRERFLSEPEGLQHPLYIKLRGLLNRHLRYTEKVSFSSYISMVVWIRKNEKDIKDVLDKHNTRFTCGDEALNKFSDQIRSRAALIMMFYMVQSSFFAISGLVLVSGLVVIRQAIRNITSVATMLKKMRFSTLFKITLMTASTTASAHIAPNSNQAVMQDFVERMSAR